MIFAFFVFESLDKYRMFQISYNIFWAKNNDLLAFSCFYPQLYVTKHTFEAGFVEMPSFLPANLPAPDGHFPAQTTARTVPDKEDFSLAGTKKYLSLPPKHKRLWNFLSTLSYTSTSTWSKWSATTTLGPTPSCL